MTLKDKRRARRGGDTAAYAGASRVKGLLIKARTSVDIEAAAARENIDGNEKVFGRDEVVQPELDPESMLIASEQCGTLEACVQAMAVNVHGFGYTLRPVIDLDAKDAARRIRAALYFRRYQETTAAGDAPDLAGMSPSDDDVTAERERLRLEMDVQRSKLFAHMDAFAGASSSLTRLRMRCAEEREYVGWSAMEIARGSNGEVARGYYVPAWTIRATEEEDPIEVDEVEYVTAIHTRRVRLSRRFRRLVQRRRGGGDAVWFKQVGDPRVISRLTGKAFVDQAAFKRAMDDRALPAEDQPATEMWWDPIAWPRCPTGMPRWAGVLPSVLGMRQADEVNLDYFANNTIPPLVVLVNGGVLADGTHDRIADFLRSQGKGRQLMNRTLVLEAVPADKDIGEARPAAPQIKMEPLRQLQLQDATHQNYDARNAEKIGQAFRLPPLIYGGHKDFNRATADAQLYQAEKAVFSPERQAWDYTFNRTFVAGDWKCPLWRVQSNSPLEVDAETRLAIIEGLVRSAAITPAEARQEAGPLLGRDDLDPIDEWWMHMPPALAAMGVTPEPAPTETKDFEARRRAERDGLVSASEEDIRAMLPPALADEVLALRRPK